VRSAARQDDLADAETSRLVLVELERRDEFARERLYLAPNDVECYSRLLLRQLSRARAAVERQLALHRLDLGRCAVERARERDIKGRAAPFDDPRELADATVRDGEGRAVMADRNGNERGALAVIRSA